MKNERVGWLSFGLTVIFSLGMLWALIFAAIRCLAQISWFNSSDRGAVIAFFGFGIPMLLTAKATTHIWRHNQELMKVYGWVCSILACLFGLCLFGIIGYETTAGEEIRSLAIVIFFFAFGIPMIILGNSGIRILYPTDPPNCMGDDC